MFSRNSANSVTKRECIPVGCVPPAFVVRGVVSAEYTLPVLNTLPPGTLPPITLAPQIPYPLILYRRYPTPPPKRHETRDTLPRKDMERGTGKGIGSMVDTYPTPTPNRQTPVKTLPSRNYCGWYIFVIKSVRTYQLLLETKKLPQYQQDTGGPVGLLTQFMLQSFIRFPEFATVTEFPFQIRKTPKSKVFFQSVQPFGATSAFSSENKNAFQ